MFDDKNLWRKRAGGRVKELSRYLKYIFNGHLVVVLLFLIGTASFYYQKWLETLPADFPAEEMIALIIGLFLTYSPVYNFLVEADKVYLIVVEDKLKGYFLRSGVASLVFQGYILLLVLAVLMPMYAQVNDNGFGMFLPFLLVLLVVKGWNLAAKWRILYFVQLSVHRWDMIVRYFINGTFTYLLLKQANFIILLVMGMVMLLYYHSFYLRTSKMGLKWDMLIEQEEKRMGSFYRLANMFTDVPTIKESVKRRKYLDFLLSRIKFSQDHTFLYLFSRAFLRSADYLGLFVRLTVIGSLAIYFISFGLGQILLSLLFLYLTGFQLLPLMKHHQNKLWIDLYPVAAKYKQAAFHTMLMIILSVEAILFALLILLKGEATAALLSFTAGLLFNYLFVYYYSKNRLKTL